MELKDIIHNPFKKKESFLTRMLIMRFSALGDVAMTVPVIHSLAEQNRDLRITVLTRNSFTPMFEWLPANVEVRGVDLESYDGIIGLENLHSDLSKYNFDIVVDLHDVLRTKFLRNRFRLGGAKVAVIDKGRKEKRQLIGNGMTAQALKPATERYADVFRSLGYTLDVEYKKAFNPLTENFKDVRSFAGRKQEGEVWIGIAPFAAHPQKVYPLDKMHTVANMLQKKGYKIFLFGAGAEEAKELETWESADIKSICGKLGGLHNELLLISELDVMVSMDSANMHLASLVGTPVVSIWGATHPKAGFAGYGQSESNIIQADLECRPCSVYGKKSCKFGDLRCMNDIKPETIVRKVEEVMKKR